MVQLTILSALVVMIVVSRLSPTSEELHASFAGAQKFYSSGAYDQAIEGYQQIAGNDSRFLDTDAVLVTVGDITAPLKEVALYQTGNAHFKMAEEALGRAARTRDPDGQALHKAEAVRLFEMAAELFVETESESVEPALKALARSQAISSWYLVADYERTIEGARLLIEHYPDSKYVINAMYDIGWSYYEREEYPQSIEAFEQLVGRFSTGYRVNRALFQLGEAYYHLERYAEAIPRYQRLVDSQRIGQMSEREILLMKREKIAGLVDETALELAAKALLRVGVCYARIGEYDAAAQAFQTVATEFADERRLAEGAYLRHADMHCEREDFDSCLDVYRTAIDAQRDLLSKARLQLLLANRQFEIGEYEDAVREYDRYRDLHEVRAAQAGLSIEGVGLQIARTWFREAEQHPESDRLDFHRRAEAELRRTLEAYPGSDYDIELRFNLALALQLQDDGTKLEEALRIFRGVSDAPDSEGYRKGALFQVARIYQTRSQFEEAATEYRGLIAEYGDDEDVDIARFELGALQREMGESRAAVQTFLEVRAEAELFARSRQEAAQVLLLDDESLRAIEVLGTGLEGLDAEEEHQTRALFHYLMGASHSRLADHASALIQFEAAVTDAGADLLERALYGRGVTLLKLRQYADAARDLERQWTEPELQASAPRLLATAYTSLGRFQEALEVYDELAQTASSALERAELYLAQAEISFRERRYRDVVAACLKVAELDFEEALLPPDGRPYYVAEKALFLTADASLQLGQPQGAEAATATGLERYANGVYAAEFLFLGGLAALQLDNHDYAAAVLAKMLERYPGHKDEGYAHYYLGFSRYNQTRFGEAVGHFITVLDRFPHLDVAADARYRLAESHYNLNQFDQARQSYRRVVEDYPSSTVAEDALYNIAWCLLNAESSDDDGLESTKRAFAAYAERYPQGRHLPTVRYTIAEMSFNAGEYEEAYALFSSIRDDFPASAVAEQAVAVLPELREAIAFSEYSEAMALFNQAVDEEDQAKMREALAPLEQVWQRYPDTPGGIAAKVNVGVCHQRLQEWREAVAAFEEVIAEGEGGNEQVTPNVLEFAQRRRDSIVRKRL